MNATKTAYLKAGDTTGAIESAAQISVQDVQEFLVHEAALLDEWKLEEWLKLMDGEARYLIPSLDKPNGDFRNTLFIVVDDMATLRSRVRQLLGRSTWSENPHSRTRRLVTNFRITGRGDEGEVTAEANFSVWRFKDEQTDVYVGRYVHRLVRGVSGGLLFRERKAVLDMETLRPQGKISFIL